jgi:hypothetical protein
MKRKIISYKSSKVLITILFIGFYIHGYSQTGLIGAWRRVNPNMKTQDIKNKQIKKWDLEIYADSTFHMQGDTAVQTSTVSGWHVGEDYKGTWEQNDSTYLTLWIGPKKERMFLTYKIVKLTSKKLLLRSLPDTKSNKKNDIKYLRL